ncbi:MAG: DASH family cryptochrome [Burkholderiaceae bacterium]|nr:DASH family cryptochrome [Burkholderiaceae bacterium]MDP4968818.1 DASH family cryptochrome [Burkholderiaceae bacterium]MDP5111547.1 DASH family cryptochrome [Burkholderiaceae bacterium]
MSTLIYWFRNDLRLQDSPALSKACREATQLIPVYVLAPEETSTRWGFARESHQRKRHLTESLIALDTQCRELGSRLLVLQGDASTTLSALVQFTQAQGIICEQIAAPEEQAEVERLRAQGIKVQCVWQSTMLELTTLPFTPQHMPDVFTQFRQKLEAKGLRARQTVSKPAQLPGLASNLEIESVSLRQRLEHLGSSSEANGQSRAGTAQGLQHLDHYFADELPHTYKQTRNQLSGADYSTRFSTWLATGALSAPMIVERLTQYEASRGANEGTYWIWFELVWRDYFRFLHLKYGRALYFREGLRKPDPGSEVPSLAEPTSGIALKLFEQWTQGRTKNALVNAGMNELAATGKMSNRMRQIVASYLIYDLRIDWRAGAAWFESQLLDYDVYSNQGNWLYIAGLGTDPRGGRRMNLDKQALEHDPQGLYRKQWAQT